MADTKDGNSNWLVSALALAALALALLWFFSGDEEVPSSPDLGAQLTREVPRGESPAASGDPAKNKTGRVIVGDAGDVPVVGVEEVAVITAPGSLQDAAEGSVPLVQGDQSEGPPSDMPRDRSYFGLEVIPDPGPVELERLAREAMEVPSEAEIARLREDEAVREPTEEEIEWMRKQQAAVKEPPPEVIAQMRQQAEIGPTEEDLERIRLQDERFSESLP